jgi:hypothetical protein
MLRMRALVWGIVFIIGLSFYAWAQAPAKPAVPGSVLSGGDIGFRVQSSGGKNVVGRLVVRVNGEWVDAQFASGPQIVPLQTK